MLNNYPVITICGSMRFWPQMLIVAQEYTGKGYIVLAPFVTADSDPIQKQMLDEMHRIKIDISDFVAVVSDPTGYFGESTRGEIEYATSLGISIEYHQISL